MLNKVKEESKILCYSFLYNIWEVCCHFFNYGAYIHINEELNDYKKSNNVILKISDTFTSSIEINGSAKGIGANNWTWTFNQGYCTGSSSSGSPYLIADDIFNINFDF